jgi:hypothetical protein
MEDYASIASKTVMRSKVDLCLFGGGLGADENRAFQIFSHYAK